MIRLLVDQNFNALVLGGLTRRVPGLDVVHVRDAGLAAAPDPVFWSGPRHKTEFSSPTIAGRFRPSLIPE